MGIRDPRGASFLLPVALGLALGLAGAAGARAGDDSPLRRALERELGLTEQVIEFDKAIAAIDRERESAEYARQVLRHAGAESLRQLDAYRVSGAAREKQTRRRARALYKLARGGVARLVFDPADSSTERLNRGHALRWLVKHDLRELSVHRRAEHRARQELLGAARELQSLWALQMMGDMGDALLDAGGAVVDSELGRAHVQRRRIARRSAAPTRDERRLLSAVRKARWRGADPKTADLASHRALMRPVGGRIAGRFGTYEDRVLRLPMSRNGLEFAARRSERVRAIASGTVAFIGNLPGFERVVVIDHADGYISLTGRLLTVAVEEGQELRGGQVLGRVAPKGVDDGLGRTVYLELRHGERPIDPTPYLRPRR